MKNLFVLLSLSVIVLFSACKKEDTEGATLDSTSSSTAAERDKANLEKTGIDMVHNMDEMRNQDGLKTFAYLTSELFSYDDPIGDSLNNRVSEEEPQKKSIGSFKTLQDFTESKSGLVDLAESMKSGQENTPETQEMWENLWGTYEWNTEDTNWSYTAGGTTVKFLFPSSASETTNNAVFEITKYEVQMNYLYAIDSVEYEGPLSLEWYISVDGSELVNYVFSATYNDGIPSDISSELTASPFSFLVTVKNTVNEDASVAYSLKKGTKTIIGYGAGAAGDWSQTNISNNTYEVYDYYDHYEDDSVFYDSVEIDKIIYEANMYVVIMDVRIAGFVQFDDLYNEIISIESDGSLTEEQEKNQMSQAINQYVSLDVRYESTKNLIADMEAYPVYVEDEYCYWDGSEDVCEPDNYYEIDLRMVFPDGSKVDMETYFESGFADLVAELNDFMEEMATEYDFEYDPIEY